MASFCDWMLQGLEADELLTAICQDFDSFCVFPREVPLCQNKIYDYLKYRAVT
jgi:hypothetical protein